MSCRRDRIRLIPQSVVCAPRTGPAGRFPLCAALPEGVSTVAHDRNPSPLLRADRRGQPAGEHRHGEQGEGRSHKDGPIPRTDVDKPQSEPGALLPAAHSDGRHRGSPRRAGSRRATGASPPRDGHSGYPGRDRCGHDASTANSQNGAADPDSRLAARGQAAARRGPSVVGHH